MVSNGTRFFFIPGSGCGVEDFLHLAPLHILLKHCTQRSLPIIFIIINCNKCFLSLMYLSWIQETYSYPLLPCCHSCLYHPKTFLLHYYQWNFQNSSSILNRCLILPVMYADPALLWVVNPPFEFHFISVKKGQELQELL